MSILLIIAIIAGMIYLALNKFAIEAIDEVARLTFFAALLAFFLK